MAMVVLGAIWAPMEEKGMSMRAAEELDGGAGVAIVNGGREKAWRSMKEEVIPINYKKLLNKYWKAV
jgi:hypothetical protein